MDREGKKKRKRKRGRERGGGERLIKREIEEKREKEI